MLTDYRRLSSLPVLLAMSLVLVCCSPQQPAPQQGGEQSAATDPLPSWNDGAAKQAILRFVAAATDPGSPDFVPESRRIAVFDNDGTLWSEQPAYFQLLFAMDRIRELAPAHPEWKSEQPFKGVLEGDLKAVAASGEHGLMQLLLASHTGTTTMEFKQIVEEWISEARHPQLGRPFTDLVFQPMLELLDHLRASGFKTFIVSGGGIEFMRPWVEEVYGIPPEQVVGSTFRVQFEMRDGEPVLIRMPEIDFIDDKDGKPVGIHKFIGRSPIAAFGNSDGDLQMLQYTAAGDGARLMLLVHHDDAEREYAYDRDSHIGRLDVALDEGRERGWTVVSMKDDWNRIYRFEE